MADHDGHTINVGPVTVGVDTDAIRDEMATTTDLWQWRAWVEDLLPEVERLRAEVAQLDAVCRWNREHVATVVDEEFGLRIGGKACEHPSLTGGRCDVCGWTAAWDEEVA